MKNESQNGFRDPTTLTKWTKWFLYAQIALAVVAISSNLLEYQLFADFNSVANLFDQVSNAVVVVLSLLMAVLVRRIQRMQMARVGTE
jgi:succinate dehydrogenase hydrophobic anchor subunit